MGTRIVYVDICKEMGSLRGLCDWRGGNTEGSEGVVLCYAMLVSLLFRTGLKAPPWETNNSLSWRKHQGPDGRAKGCIFVLANCWNVNSLWSIVIVSFTGRSLTLGASVCKTQIVHIVLGRT